MAKPGADIHPDHERLELALQSARLGEYDWDMVRDVVSVGPRMSAITGLPVGEWPAERGEFLYRGVHPEEREATRRSIEEAMRAEGRFEVEYRRIREDDGRIIWTRTSGVLVSDEQGRPLRAVGLVQDIGERRAEEDRRRALMA